MFRLEKNKGLESRDMQIKGMDYTVMEQLKDLETGSEKLLAAGQIYFSILHFKPIYIVNWGLEKLCLFDLP